MLHTWHLTFSLRIPQTWLLLLNRVISQKAYSYQATKQTETADLTTKSHRLQTNPRRWWGKSPYIYTADITSYPTLTQISWFSKPDEDRGKSTISMMEKTQTSTDMLKHNTFFTDTRCLPLASRAYLSAFTEVNPSSDSQISKAEEPVMNLNLARCSLWGSYKQLESQLTEVSDTSPRKQIFSLSFKCEIPWSNTWEKLSIDTKFKPSIMQGYFSHSLAG